MATYEAWGTRTAEYGSTPDRQRANTKEEDSTGLLNEGQRYRDLKAGVLLQAFSSADLADVEPMKVTEQSYLI